MTQENIKDFTIATVFIFVSSVAILYFALGYPDLNGQQSVLIQNPVFNNTANNLSSNLGNYQTQQNVNINISVSDEPQTSVQGLYLVSQTANARNILGQLLGTFAIITTLLGNMFGLSGGQFTIISGAILSLFGGVLLYLTIKWLRIGQ